MYCFYEFLILTFEKTHLQDKVEIYNSDYLMCLNSLEKKNEKLDIIYIDPPYALNLIENSIDMIIKMKNIDKNTLEQSKKKLKVEKNSIEEMIIDEIYERGE